MKQEERSGNISDDNVLRDITKSNPRPTAREIAFRARESHSTIIRRLAQIGKVKKMEERVPCEFADAPKLIYRQI
mgnify:CR=1 FL=1